MKILTLDLGTTTGWAFRDGEKLLSGRHSFKTARHEGAGMRPHRFKLWLDLLCSVNGVPDFVYFEEVRRHNSVTAGHVYGGFMNMLMAWCEEHGAKYSSVPVGTIKKAATGKGNASKKDMIVAAVYRYGIIPDDDNHADALGILTYAEVVLHGDSKSL